ncbi:MAG: alpha-L-fucosidase [Lentisphaerae bacterium]|nr:alpha-L-fucosidase [Lentisphaerota bacterium]
MTEERLDVYAHSEGTADWRSQYPQELVDRLEWFQDLKLGLILHWGIYSLWDCCESWPLVPDDTWARGGDPKCWLDCGKDIKKFQEAYWALNRSFNPVDFDPTSWAKAAKDAGFKYVNFTTKHHDGFCMWDTKTTDYKVTHPDCPHHSSPNADIARAVFDACRAEGLAISCYFSKADWHCPHYWNPQWPANTRCHNYDRFEHPEIWEKFKAFTFAQIEELMSQYGPIDVLWLDGGQVGPPHQDIDMASIAAMARKHQPGLIIVDRVITGEFENLITPEHEIPDAPLDEPWESCLVMGEGWKYARPDEEFKPLTEILRMVVETVSKGGNLLLGHGPTPQGTFQETALERMKGLGAWLSVNGDAIYETRPIPPYGEGERIRFTQKAGKVYAFVYAREQVEAGTSDRVTIQSFVPKAGSALTMLGVDEALEWRNEAEGFSVMLPPRSEADAQWPVVVAFEPSS